MNKGKVDFDQFKRAIEKIGVVMNEFDLELVFNNYEATGDGLLDFKEFSSAFISKDRKWFNDLDHKLPENAQFVDTYLSEKNAREA